MPFTPFHLGPALALGLPLRRWIHAPTFIIANVVVDLEPLTVLTLGLRYPLHGYLHTFVGALALGLALSCLMYVLERFLNPLWRRLFLETERNLGLGAFIISGISGTLLHVLMDSPLYTDIEPLWPIPTNPFYNPGLAGTIYGICVLMGLAGIIYYIYITVKSIDNLRKSLVSMRIARE